MPSLVLFKMRGEVPLSPAAPKWPKDRSKNKIQRGCETNKFPNQSNRGEFPTDLRAGRGRDRPGLAEEGLEPVGPDWPRKLNPN